MSGQVSYDVMPSGVMCGKLKILYDTVNGRKEVISITKNAIVTHRDLIHSQGFHSLLVSGKEAQCREAWSNRTANQSMEIWIHVRKGIDSIRGNFLS